MEAVSGLVVGESRPITLMADDGFATAGDHKVYMVVDSDPIPFGVIDELEEVGNVSPVLNVTVQQDSAPTPTPTPTEEPQPDPPGSLAGQAFIIASGGQILPQAGVEVNVYENASGNLAGTVFTDVNGIYFFSALDPGTYTVTGCIRIDAIDHFFSLSGVVINSGGVTTADLFLDVGPCV
jgi:hypothetical protein